MRLEAWERPMVKNAVSACFVSLAAITALLGAGSTMFSAFLGHEGEWPTALLITMSVLVAAVGIGTGWWVYGRRSVVVNTRVYKDRFGLAYLALQQKLLFDLAYEVLFIRPFMRAADWMWQFDARAIDAVVNLAGKAWVVLAAWSWRFDGRVIDGIVNGLASLTRNTGSGLRSLQSGRLQSYQRLVLSAVIVFMLYLVLYVVVKGA